MEIFVNTILKNSIMDPDKKIFDEFSLVGQEVNNRGLISSHAGNISVRIDNKIIITRSGSMLGHLRPEDIVEIEVDKTYSIDDNSASTEAIVHRVVYKKTSAKAILHTHNPYCTVLSYILKEIKCADVEGKYFLKTIPVIECKNPTASEELAEKVSEQLTVNPVAIIKTHGIFAKGETLIEAMKYITGAEQSAEIIYRLLLLGKH